VKDVRQVIAETRRVLRPGGFFFFDTINRTRMAGFVIVTLGERVLKILPKGTHDPRGFITPDELERELRLAGFGPAFMRGLGPTGIDRRGDIMFGAWPNKSVMYAGYARLR
jgi:2-polyprenyl-6-hydroxyphenyl methylase/3-demethylubiquinone-9 3-methyltransferase